MNHRTSAAACAALALLALEACSCGTGQQTAPPPVGEVIGRAEMAEGVPVSPCRATLLGTPLGARCAEDGSFHIKGVPAGRWDLRLEAAPEAGLAARRLPVAANSGAITDTGPIRLLRPGKIGGRVSPTPARGVILTVLGDQAVAAANENGGYLIEGVSPGLHTLMLLSNSGTILRQSVMVASGEITSGIDFDLSEASARTAVEVKGLALRTNAADQGHAGLVVELAEAIGGSVLATAATTATGAFALSAQPGIYLVRAHEDGSARAAVLPWLVVTGVSQVALASPLLVPGEPAATSSDQDDDGVPDAEDAFPADPAEWSDRDGDGVGDQADLLSEGGTEIDQQPPTPDTDEDGLFDFEDLCPAVRDPEQVDADLDRVGNACDNCVADPNPDQSDEDQDGIGDLCEAECQSHADCPAEKLCAWGSCVECLTSAQCGDRVCKAGQCADCTSTPDCSGGELCDERLGRCVECLRGSDCPADHACIAGVCFAECSADAQCPGRYCVAGACADCRGNADCPEGWCDAGLCRRACVSDASCTGGRSCDLATGTCVEPCSGSRCAAGESCISGVCRLVCDEVVPCPAGTRCAVTDEQSICLPECAVDGDCEFKPHTRCQLGQCVPDGSCGSDLDCETSQLCVAGRCAPRPTTADPATGSYACSNPCQCRLGEICAQGVCRADLLTLPDGYPRSLLPTRFVSAEGAGDGAAPSASSASLEAVVAAASSGDVIAVRGGDSLGLSSAIALARGNVAVVGGFLECTSLRWVRDPGTRSTVTSPLGHFSVPGTPTAPIDRVVLMNLDLISTDPKPTARWLVNAASAPQLVLAGLSLKIPAFNAAGSGRPTFGAVHCSDCERVSFTDLYVHPIAAIWDQETLYGVYLKSGSGTIARVTSAGFSAGRGGNVVRADATVGPLTIERISGTGMATAMSTSGVAVVGCGKDPVTNASHPLVIRDSDLAFHGFNPGSGGGSLEQPWRAISVSGCGQVTITGNVVDGQLQSGNHVEKPRIGLSVTDSSGTISGNRVVFPGFPRSDAFTALEIVGPNADLVVEGNSSVDGTSTAAVLVSIADVSRGTVRLSRNEFSSDSVSTTATGLRVSNLRSPAALVVEESQFRLPTVGTGCTDSRGFWISGSIGRVERSQFYAANAALSAAGVVDGDSQLELHQSFLSAGVSTAGASACPAARSLGLRLDAGARLWAVGNTIDGGGAVTSLSASYGFVCDHAATATLTSNLVSGGGAATHLMAVGQNGEGCLVPAEFRANYFWYAAAGARSEGEQVDLVATAGAPGSPDANGNIAGDEAGCYDPTVPQPSYVIANPSPCVDRGLLGQRLDQTQIDKDLEGTARLSGAAPDIGCHEAQ